jgi:hypothetical protein
MRWVSTAPEAGGQRPHPAARREALRVTALQDGLAATVQALLAEVCAQTRPAMMPDERGGVVGDLVPGIDRAPLELDVLSALDHRIEAAEPFQDGPPERHVAARNVRGAVRPEQLRDGTARAARHRPGGQGLIRWWDVRTAGSADTLANRGES